MFAGHEKCELDNYAGMNTLNSDLFLLKAPKDGHKNVCFSPKQFFLEKFVGQEKSSFDK